MHYRLTRVARTQTSEIYLAWRDERRVAQIDLHYGTDMIQGTVILEEDVEEDAIHALIKQVDRDIVASYLQDYERENFLVSVFRGEEILTTSDEDHEDDDEHFSW